MEFKNLSPWNWFHKERGTHPATIPITYRQQDSYLPVNRLHNQIDRLFGDMFLGDSDGFFPRLWPTQDLGLSFFPRLDIKESKNHYDIQIEVPGMEREDFDIQMEGNNLLVRGEKKFEQESNERNYHCRERSFGEFRRVLMLPEDADVKSIQANYNNGVLSVSISKKPRAQVPGRRIEVKG